MTLIHSCRVTAILASAYQFQPMRWDNQAIYATSRLLDEISNGNQERVNWKVEQGSCAVKGHKYIHIAKLTQSLLKQFKWDTFGHPQFSKDLAPSHYQLFPMLTLLLVLNYKLW